MTFSRDIAKRTVWGEARGEGEEGQRAVAHVLMNRVADGRWGPNLGSVCLADRQFSCWNARDPNRPLMIGLADDDPQLLKIGRIVDAAATGQDGGDTTDGAMFYYADSIDPPSWAADMIVTKKIGHHTFLKERK